MSLFHRKKSGREPEPEAEPQAGKIPEDIDSAITEMIKKEETRAHYSKSNLWDKIKKTFAVIGYEVIEKVLLLYYCATDKHSPLTAAQKTIIFSVLGYFILPFDCIPDYLPAVGFTDDIAAITAALTVISSAMKDRPEELQKMQERAKAKASEFLNKTK